MIVNKRVFAVLLLGIMAWFAYYGPRVGSLRDLADLCVVIELVSRTSKRKMRA
jgi:hypothetical protein